ncbi:MAG: hypothetical protein RL701_3172 [Pseudomonadota bacterium]
MCQVCARKFLAQLPSPRHIHLRRRPAQYRWVADPTQSEASREHAGLRRRRGTWQAARGRTPLVLLTPSGQTLMQFNSLLDVRPPYYALDRVELHKPGFVGARIRPEQPLGHEVGPLAAAEAGRHLAILGACACRSLRESNPEYEHHYYLPQRARLLRHPDRTPTQQPRFAASARSESRKGRNATAHSVLYAADSGATLFELDVSYRVLSQGAFERVFAPHKRDLRATPREDATRDLEQLVALRSNPYQKPLPLEITRRTPESVRARLRTVTPDLCAGHFPLYPSLPVAVLMHALSSLCGEALRGRWGNAARYRVVAADVSAERLAFVGERLLFEAAFRQSNGDREHYQAWAMLEDGRSIGWMAIELQPVRHDMRIERTTPAFI